MKALPRGQKRKSHPLTNLDRCIVDVNRALTHAPGFLYFIGMVKLSHFSNHNLIFGRIRYTRGELH